jgi:sugar phosphate isomerase/epimerase
MAEVYLASSAIQGFDGLRTIDEAQKVGFDGVQLFLDPRYREDDYLRAVIDRLAFANLGLVVHLPNEVVTEDIVPARELIRSVPGSRALIHYLPATRLPIIEGVEVGWENSVIGYNLDHLSQVKAAVKRDRTFYVFDMGRPLVLEGKVDSTTAVREVREEIRNLRHGVDMIHTADKDDWDTRFRGHWRAMSHGICAAFLNDLRAFDGVVVLEHEDLQMAIDSLGVLK